MRVAVVWGVLGGGPLFWSVFTVLHVFSFLLLSLRIYYVGQFRLGETPSLAYLASYLPLRHPTAHHPPSALAPPAPAPTVRCPRIANS